MKILAISGSMRDGSQSRAVAEYLCGRLQDVEVELLDLNEHRLPLFDDSPKGAWQEIWEPISQQMAEADGFILVSPEWDGMFSAGLHNLFNYVASAEQGVKHSMAHKAVMLVSVSSGMGGAYPLAQLRMVGPKNTHYVISPENLRFSHIKELLVDGQLTSDKVRERADYALRVLVAYAAALKNVRQSGVIDLEHFGSGV